MFYNRAVVQRRRIDDGKPIREAMKEAGLTLQQLAALTAEASPDGVGVSYQLVAFLATSRGYGRQTTSDRTATLIETALGKPAGSLFE